MSWATMLMQYDLDAAEAEALEIDQAKIDDLNRERIDLIEGEDAIFRHDRQQLEAAGPHDFEAFPF